MKYLFGSRIEEVDFDPSLFRLPNSLKVQVDNLLQGLANSDKNPLPAITYFTTNKFARVLKDYCNNFLDGSKKSPEHNLCMSLIRELGTLPRCRVVVYRTIELKFSSTYNQG